MMKSSNDEHSIPNLYLLNVFLIVAEGSVSFFSHDNTFAVEKLRKKRDWDILSLITILQVISLQLLILKRTTK